MCVKNKEDQRVAHRANEGDIDVVRPHGPFNSWARKLRRLILTCGPSCDCVRQWRLRTNDATSGAPFIFTPHKEKWTPPFLLQKKGRREPCQLPMRKHVLRRSDGRIVGIERHHVDLGSIEAIISRRHVGLKEAMLAHASKWHRATLLASQLADQLTSSEGNIRYLVDERWYSRAPPGRCGHSRGCHPRK